MPLRSGPGRLLVARRMSLGWRIIVCRASSRAYGGSGEATTLISWREDSVRTGWEEEGQCWQGGRGGLSADHGLVRGAVR